MMDITPIRTEEDYENSLERIEALMDAEFGSPEGDELDVLTTLIYAYEEEHHSFAAPDPIEFIKNVLEFRGESQTDLAKLLGSRPRASEIINKKRHLSLVHIRKITTAWKVSPASLIAGYSLAGSKRRDKRIAPKIKKPSRPVRKQLEKTG